MPSCTSPAAGGGPGRRTFRRWEVWSLHQGGDRWEVDHRNYLWREHGQDLPPPREVVLRDDLLGIEVESGPVEVRFDIAGEGD